MRRLRNIFIGALAGFILAFFIGALLNLLNYWIWKSSHSEGDFVGGMALIVLPLLGGIIGGLFRSGNRKLVIYWLLIGPTLIALASLLMAIIVDLFSH